MSCFTPPYRKGCAFALMSLAWLAASAIPAKPGLIPFTQADGTVVEIRLIGDERSHYALSEDGYLISPVDNTYYYATISDNGTVTASRFEVSPAASRPAEATAFLGTIDLAAQTSRMKARDLAASRARRIESAAASALPTRAAAKTPGVDETYPAGPGLFPGNNFPAYGEQKGLVVLVEYSDEKFRLTDPLDYFSRMLNEPGFSDLGATGSAVDFFRESSSDLFRPQFDIYGPITLPKTMSYYGGNTLQGSDIHAHEMAIDACQLLDATVDFSQYDRNGDGFIDNIFIIYAGLGEASSGVANTVWPHAAELTEFTETVYKFDGVQLSRYACSNEWMTGRPDGVGTFVHEFSHVMGLPDLYATAYNGSFTPGAWSALDVGPYNNNGMTPPLFSAFERYALGWIVPTELTPGMDVELPSIGSNVCGIVKSDLPGEYYLFENRQKTSWDTYIPGHGMLVWHIDYDAERWSSNIANNTPTHQYVDIVEADGTQSDLSRQSDAFPGTENFTSFTASTTPAFAWWSGETVDLPLTGISESTDGIITFKVSGGRTEARPAPVAKAATNVGPTSFTANWEAVADAEGYLLTVSDASTGTPVFSRRNVGDVTSYAVGGLSPDTEYIYEVAAGNPLDFSAASAATAVTTGAAPLDARTPAILGATDVTSTSFAANWEAVPGATDYILDVREKGDAQLTEWLCDFTDGVGSLPEGWRSNVTADYTVAAYCGEAVPSMRLSASSDVVYTPVFDAPIRSISFWQRGAVSSDPADVLNVFVKVGMTWQPLRTFGVETQTGGVVCTCDEIPDGAVQARIEYARKSMKGTVGLDDIRILTGDAYTPIIVEGYPARTGDARTFAVASLKPSTTYLYNIVATDGTLTSLPSAFAEVLTDEATSLSTVAAAETFYTLEGRTLTALDTVSVYDLAGRSVACLTAGSTVSLTPGLYVVKTPQGATKVLVD